MYKETFFLMQTTLTVIVNLHVQDCIVCLTKSRDINLNPTKFNMILKITSEKINKKKRVEIEQ